jgi:murein DD-endopeptidase MepM/ murein hydrolase activator NlpD
MIKFFLIIFSLFFSLPAFTQNFSINDKNIRVSYDKPTQSKKPSIADSILQEVKQSQKSNPVNVNKHENTLSQEQILLNQKILEKPQIKTDCDRDKYVCLISNIFKDRIVIELENRTFATRTISISTIFNNVQSLSNIGGTYDLILKAKQRKQIDVITQIDPTKSYGYKYNYTSIMGSIDAIHDDKYIYDLPFEINKSFKLLQGYGGNFSHQTPDNYYSYDFRMPTKTQVISARDGRIIKVEQRYTQGGPYKELLKKANTVYVEHPDGTIGIYAHLYTGGVIVKEGDYVQRGQLIAYSGNTGYSDSPHLHFNVAKITKGAKFISIPIKIRTSLGVERQLKMGNYYSK